MPRAERGALPIGAKVVCRDKSGKTVSFEAEKVLVAIGRRANTESLHLDAGQIKNDRGRIIVNDKMETSVPGVYAIGDCVFGPRSWRTPPAPWARSRRRTSWASPPSTTRVTNPTCVYMEPEAASVGLTEEQCRAQGIDYKVGKFPMSANGKALILNGGEGSGEDHRREGIRRDSRYAHHWAARDRSHLRGRTRHRREMTLDELIATIHSHPTVTETIREAALNAEKRAIHIKN